MKDKLILQEVIEVNDTECTVRFDKFLTSTNVLRGMYPDMVNYKMILFTVDGIAKFKIILNSY